MDNSVWLTQADMVELFGSSKSNISEHIKHIFEDGELDEKSVVRNFRTTAADGKKVMLDRDLAELYGVETKVLNQAVKRNSSRFPQDFMFRLSKDEYDNLTSQFVTSSWGGRRYPPYVFTENGIAMLSSVLNSNRAIKINIQIMRVFTSLRKMMIANSELKTLIEKVEKQGMNYRKRRKQCWLHRGLDKLKQILIVTMPKPYPFEMKGYL